MLKALLAIGLLTAISATAALAAPTCNVDKADWQPEQNLRNKLMAQKWTIKNVKINNGCYEVYGTDEKGKKVEMYFHPKSLEVIAGQTG